MGALFAQELFLPEPQDDDELITSSPCRIANRKRRLLLTVPCQPENHRRRTAAPQAPSPIGEYTTSFAFDSSNTTSHTHMRSETTMSAPAPMYLDGSTADIAAASKESSTVIPAGKFLELSTVSLNRKRSMLPTDAVAMSLFVQASGTRDHHWLLFMAEQLIIEDHESAVLFSRVLSQPSPVIRHLVVTGRPQRVEKNARQRHSQPNHQLTQLTERRSAMLAPQERVAAVVLGHAPDHYALGKFQGYLMEYIIAAFGDIPLLNDLLPKPQPQQSADEVGTVPGEATAPEAAALHRHGLIARPASQSPSPRITREVASMMVGIAASRSQHHFVKFALGRMKEVWSDGIQLPSHPCGSWSVISDSSCLCTELYFWSKNDAYCYVTRPSTTAWEYWCRMFTQWTWDQDVSEEKKEKYRKGMRDLVASGRPAATVEAFALAAKFPREEAQQSIREAYASHELRMRSRMITKKHKYPSSTVMWTWKWN